MYLIDRRYLGAVRRRDICDHKDAGMYTITNNVEMRQKIISANRQMSLMEMMKYQCLPFFGSAVQGD